MSTKKSPPFASYNVLKQGAIKPSEDLAPKWLKSAVAGAETSSFADEWGLPEQIALGVIHSGVNVGSKRKMNGSAAGDLDLHCDVRVR